VAALEFAGYSGRGEIGIRHTIMRNQLIVALLTCTVATELAAQGPAPVWVNARSGVYHCPGTTYYGWTGRGEYLPEASAQNLGYRANGGKPCGPVAPAIVKGTLRALLSASSVILDGGPTAPDSGLVPCRLNRIKDGDTIDCEGLGSVRLIGMDSPEEDQEPFGIAATAGFAALTPVGSILGLELGREQRDGYKRLLAYAWSNGVMINWLMVRQGWAIPLPIRPNTKYADQFSGAEELAKVEARGLWAVGGFVCRPEDRRRKTC
jgi:endonuclease YncB( thermonuclease family)